MDEIDDMVEAERLAIVKVFLVAAAVMIVLAMLRAGTIAGPVRRLAEGAERLLLPFGKGRQVMRWRFSCL